jgi:ADP-ribose pyrophosphatase
MERESVTMELNEKTLTSELVYDGRLLKVNLDTVELINGKTSWREVIRHPGAVVIVPIDEKGNIHLVRQFRYPYGRAIVEVPAGKLEFGEEHFPAAQRELSEEIGAQASEWTELGVMLPTPGFCDEVQHVYLARGLTFGETHPDEDEFLEQVTLPMEEAVAMAVDGRLEDSKTVAAILRAYLRLKGE